MQVDTLLSAQKAGGIDKTTITKSIRDQYALIDTCTVFQPMNALTLFDCQNFERGSEIPDFPEMGL